MIPGEEKAKKQFLREDSGKRKRKRAVLAGGFRRKGIRMSNALEIRGLTKAYHGFALDHIDLALPTGCVMGFIGENGAGKSTTIKLILDLIQRDAGEIRVLDQELTTENSELKERIGVVMDECNFPEGLRLKEIEKMMRSGYHSWDSDVFWKYCGRFGLAGDKRVKQLSRGMKMKLMIVVALSHASELLILDEATSGLDPIVRDEILELFLDFMQDENHTIFISSHILSDLEKICDYITFLHKGKIVVSEEKCTLLERYAVVKCSEQELARLDERAIHGVRKNSFGVEALAVRSMVPGGYVCDPATLEDIMLFYVKNEADQKGGETV